MSLRWSVEGRDWPLREHSRFVTQGALRWHVQVLGDGPPLLLLHGTGAATHSWRDLAPLLAERYTVVAPDLPGHGFSAGRPPGGMTMAAMAKAIRGLLATLEVAPDAIVGHSAGAALGARMALDGIAEPQTIVGLGAALLPFPDLAAALFPTMARMLFVNPFAPHLFAGMARMQGETARFVVRATGSTIEPEGVALYERLLRDPDHVGAAIAMMAEWDLDALKRDLPRLAPPLRLIHGERDAAIPIATAREAAALVPDGRTTGLPGLGHLAHEERPGEVAALILAALKDSA
ncbi:alpha/beta hydrolase [Sphingomonas spermidinifaciens]|uniref:Alpha/beta hydrolase n=1 Tax=Sphingomonas spermidinifaciens TaxID=1141889 RepID=A0A2A4B5A6_9SPHN|nr:alpha/beta fold hydrolase BchO [Sphingomonas spermidinifaciens]PCD03621.1 alpha/beta hydrolase [Sphingomonas spermidinifaciens]